MSGLDLGLGLGLGLGLRGYHERACSTMKPASKGMRYKCDVAF